MSEPKIGARGREVILSGWRLVCHACGFKYPHNAACKASCCTKPELHVHNTERPCDRCAD
jgi:hypothetical protein